MYKLTGYKNKEKRIRYLKEYQAKWRISEKGRKYFREYMRKHRNCRPGKSNLKQHNMGRRYEQLALSLIPKSELSNDRSVDIKWGNKLIEVKARNFRTSKSSWCFRKNNNKATHLMFFCIENNQLKKTLFIPANEMTFSIGVSKKSKWDKYKLSI